MGLAGATLRVARATDRMEEIRGFYVEGLGLELLAMFEDHAGFDGLILGAPQSPYHLEFTRKRGRPAGAAPDPESLLVFYLPGRAEWQAAVDRLHAFGARPVPSSNPYWDAQGLTFEDPDGFRIVLQRAAWPL
jgi:catechol 2,3-dioxygenase-like lactoylglutathione lyase family enzyme